MRLYALLLLFITANCDRIIAQKNHITFEENIDSVKYQLYLLAPLGRKTTLMFESLKYLKPDYEKNTLKLLKLDFEKEVKYPQSYTTSEQLRRRVEQNKTKKRTNRNTKKKVVRNSKASPLIIFPSGLNVGHRLGKRDDIVFISIRYFQNKDMAQTYATLLEKSKYFVKGSVILVFTEKEAFQFFMKSFRN